MKMTSIRMIDTMDADTYYLDDGRCIILDRPCTRGDCRSCAFAFAKFTEKKTTTTTTTTPKK